MIIKEGLFKNIPEILAIQKLAFYEVAKYYNNYRLGSLQTTIFDLEKTFDTFKYYIVVIDNDIVGSIRAKEINDYCKIENVIVHPNYQNKGIGKLLIKQVEQDFSNCSSFQLFTGKDTPKNVNFYEKLGFIITNNLKATETEPELVIMEKCMIKGR